MQLFLGWLLLALPLARAQNWETREPMLTPRFAMSALYWNNQIVVIGGRDAQDSILATVESYDLSTGQWQPFAANLNEARYSAAAIVYRGRMFVIGGCGKDQQVLKSVEFYNETTQRWEREPSLAIAREGAAAAVVNDTLYVMGGFDGASYLKSIEYFRHEASSWWLSWWSLSAPRAWLSAVTLRDSIFTAGGLLFGPVGVLERYHISDGNQRRASMLTPRGRMAAVNFEGKLWTLGGSDQHGASAVVEIYDYTSNSWESGPGLLSARELNAALAIFDKIFIIGGRTAEGAVLGTLETLGLPTGVAEHAAIPRAPELKSYPNPFVTSARIVWRSLASNQTQTVVEVFDLRGARVLRRFLSSNSADFEFTWHGQDETGAIVRDGIYFITVRSGDFVLRRKLLKLKR